MIRLKKLFAYSFALIAVALCASAAERRTDLTLLGSANQLLSGGTLTIKSGATFVIESGGTLTIKSGATFVIESGATFDLPAGSVAWADVSKTSSSLADLATRSASDLNSGTLPDGRFPATLPAASGVNLTSLTAGNITGVIPIANLATGTPNGAKFIRDDGTLATPAGSGTVTNTGGDLTANAVVLGAGTVDAKVVPGISTDGTSKLNLGEAGTSVGKIGLANATSGSITLQPPTGALGTVTLTVPAATDTLIGRATPDTLTGKQWVISAALGTDDTYEGTAINGLTAGATIAQWEAVYLGGSSTWLLADANGSGTYPARGLAVAAYSSTNAAIILVSGTVRNDAWAWTPGGTIYLSTTAGGLTQTAPSTSADKVQQVGLALTADIAFFNFASGEYLTVE